MWGGGKRERPPHTSYARPLPASATWPHIAHIRALVCIERQLSACSRRALRDVAGFVEAIERPLRAPMDLSAPPADVNGQSAAHFHAHLHDVWGPGLAPTAAPTHRVLSFATPLADVTGWSESPLTSRSGAERDAAGVYGSEMLGRPDPPECSTGGTGAEPLLIGGALGVRRVAAVVPVADALTALSPPSGRPAASSHPRRRRGLSAGAAAVPGSSTAARDAAARMLTLGAHSSAGTPLGGFWAESRATIAAGGSGSDEKTDVRKHGSNRGGPVVDTVACDPPHLLLAADGVPVSYAPLPDPTPSPNRHLHVLQSVSASPLSALALETLAAEGLGGAAERSASYLEGLFRLGAPHRAWGSAAGASGMLSPVGESSPLEPDLSWSGDAGTGVASGAAFGPATDAALAPATSGARLRHAPPLSQNPFRLDEASPRGGAPATHGLFSIGSPTSSVGGATFGSATAREPGVDVLPASSRS